MLHALPVLWLLQTPWCRKRVLRSLLALQLLRACCRCHVLLMYCVCVLVQKKRCKSARPCLLSAVGRCGGSGGSLPSLWRPVMGEGAQSGGSILDAGGRSREMRVEPAARRVPGQKLSNTTGSGRCVRQAAATAPTRGG